MTTAILGAGMAGLSAASTLAAAGHNVVIFEKSRGVGGRTTTRRHGDYRFDHGAQYFTVRDEGFRAQVDRWREAGIVAPWEGRICVWDVDGPKPTTPGHHRFVGVPGMNAMCHGMAEGLEVHLKTRIEKVIRTSSGWELTDSEGHVHGGFETLVSSLPPAQALALLGKECSLAQAISRATMAPCWAAMFVLDQNPSWDWHGLFVNESGPIRWIARNGSKAGRPGHEVLIVHAGQEWTESNLECQPEEAAEALWQALTTLLPLGDIEPTLRMAHRWRYSVADGSPEVPCLSDAEAQLIVCGDWCIGARVEGAWLSGRAAGEIAREMGRQVGDGC